MIRVDDRFVPDPLRQESEAELASRKDKETFVDYEFKVYKGSFSNFASNHAFKLMVPGVGTVHGFAARPNLEIPEVKAGFEGALDQTVQWFKKTL